MPPPLGRAQLDNQPRPLPTPKSKPGIATLLDTYRTNVLYSKTSGTSADGLSGSAPLLPPNRWLRTGWRCMTWAAHKSQPPGYPAVTQGSTRGLIERTAIARRENTDATRTLHSLRAKPCPFRRHDPSGEPGLIEVEWGSPVLPNTRPRSITKAPRSALGLGEASPRDPLVSTWETAHSPALHDGRSTTQPDALTQLTDGKPMHSPQEYFQRPSFHRDLPRYFDTLPRFVL
jgi:hypothetical protein